MTPQKNQPKVVRATGKGKPTPLLQQLRNLRLSIGKRSSPESRVGKPFWNTAPTAPSTGKETLRIPSSTLCEAG